MPLINHLRYRPEIDGLRAVAVLSVILFHAGFRCSGGYVGVDVFFVVSGFLITSLIWSDLETGRFTFAHFWERRARRIVPALVVVTIVTLVIGWFVLLPADLENLGRASASQSVFAANFHYLQDSGYFKGVAEEKPLLHTWSLAVEEQFYLIVPFLLFGIYRSKVLRNRTAIISIFATIFAVSLGISIYGLTRFPWATFYLLPTRAWELLAGALVAFLPVFPRLSRSLREFLSLVGLTLILIPVFVYTSETPFPGMAAVPVCLGAALVILANARSEGSAPTILGAALSVRPVVFIGLISYSLYLWHWPLLAFSRYLALSPLPFGYRAAVLGLGLFLAILSWKYVELPFRQRKLGASRKSLFTYAGVGLAAVLGCGLLGVVMRGFPRRYPAEAQEFANAKFDMGFINEITTEDVHNDNLLPIGVLDPKLPATVLVWGDSHAMAAMPAFDAFLKENGVAGRAATHSQTPPVLDWITPFKGAYADSISFNTAVFSYITSRKIPVVILVASWNGYLGGGKDESFNSALVETVRRLEGAGSQVWILLNVPAQSFDVPRVLSRSVISGANIESMYARPRARDEFDRLDLNTISQIKDSGGRFIDPKPRFLDSAGQHYIVQYGGTVLFRDGHHLTTKGAKLILLPLLRGTITIGR